MRAGFPCHAPVATLKRELVAGIRRAVEQPSFALSIKRRPVLMRNPEELHAKKSELRSRNDLRNPGSELPVQLRCELLT